MSKRLTSRRGFFLLASLLLFSAVLSGAEMRGITEENDNYVLIYHIDCLKCTLVDDNGLATLAAIFISMIQHKSEENTPWEEVRKQKVDETLWIKSLPLVVAAFDKAIKYAESNASEEQTLKDLKAAYESLHKNCIANNEIPTFEILNTFSGPVGKHLKKKEYSGSDWYKIYEIFFQRDPVLMLPVESYAMCRQTIEGEVGSIVDKFLENPHDEYAGMTNDQFCDLQEMILRTVHSNPMAYPIILKTVQELNKK